MSANLAMRSAVRAAIATNSRFPASVGVWGAPNCGLLDAFVGAPRDIPLLLPDTVTCLLARHCQAFLGREDPPSTRCNDKLALCQRLVLDVGGRATAMSIAQAIPGMREFVKKSIPMGRMGSAEDVADVAEFFAGGLSAFVSGQNLCITGGAIA